MSYQLGSVDNDHRQGLFAERRDNESGPRLRGLVVTAVALVVMAVFAGGLWFAYMEGVRHAGGGGGDVPLIRADERPTKVKPEKPGGMEIPDRDKLIYTQKRTAVEHLLPPPEKPMPRPLPSSPPLASAAPAHPEVPSPPSASATPPGAPAHSAATAPGTTTPATSPGGTPGPTPGPAAASAPGTPAPATRPQQQSAGSAPAKPATANSPPAKTGGSRLQLGSVRSEEAAHQEWDRLKRTNSELLGSLSATPLRADLGDKGVFYRIQTGPVADPERICGELKRRNIGCIIAR